MSLCMSPSAFLPSHQVTSCKILLRQNKSHMQNLNLKKEIKKVEICTIKMMDVFYLTLIRGLNLVAKPALSIDRISASN